MDLSCFREHGYQVFRGVFTPGEVAGVRAHLTGAMRVMLDELHRTFGTADEAGLCAAIDAATGARFEHLDQNLRNMMSGHFPLSARLDPEMWAVPRAAGLRRVLETVLGDERLFMHMPPTSRFVLAGNRHAGVPAHQDVSYNPHMTDFVTVWVPFTVIDERCGGVMVYEQTNRPLELLADKGRKFWFEGVDTGARPGVHCTMDPGDCLVLNRWVVHASVPNTSDRTRISTDFRFFPSREKSTKHYLDMQEWRVVNPSAAAA
ncbi:1-deoxypentalenic acid 11-beta-hydroxylase [Gemmata sp. SH-PL17]|uniref:phytanoyl-CoA dioxygenase family protein n=1 Tax=Gemmata sp. SH-PL17 TaxID=1630693 RepID=UPI0004B18096|nr:phytanoyl-CoA dioxygenase family protein [Gemmata sp. SH-PL17]AMV25614.1 1-deoxypentalenic acid 11-beta-hydroxylase [Gemmata sp. SH-PL17]